MFPVLGFGAKLPGGLISHEFAVVSLQSGDMHFFVLFLLFFVCFFFFFCSPSETLGVTILMRFLCMTVKQQIV